MNASTQTPHEALKTILSIQDLFHVGVNGVTLSTDRAHELLREVYDIAQRAQPVDFWHPVKVEDTTGKPPLYKDTTGTLLKALKLIAFRSSLFVRAKYLGSKDTQLLESVHAMANDAIAAAQVPA